MTSVTDGVVEFRFFRPNANEARIAGDFNAWDQSAHAMSPQGDGWWVARVEIKAGEYRFKYLADGQWYTDFASHGVELNPTGWNSVLVVPRAQRARTQEKYAA